VRHRKKRGKTILRCPQCGSNRIYIEAGMITGQRYRCPACEYVGSFVLEEDVPEGALSPDAPLK
jgi:transposase-like protein